MDQDRFSRALCFVLAGGVEIYPVRVKRRDTGKLAFRISRNGNTLVCSRFNRTESLHPGDYRDLTANASYQLALDAYLKRDILPE